MLKSTEWQELSVFQRELTRLKHGTKGKNLLDNELAVVVSYLEKRQQELIEKKNEIR